MNESQARNDEDLRHVMRLSQSEVRVDDDWLDDELPYAIKNNQFFWSGSPLFCDNIVQIY